MTHSRFDIGKPAAMIVLSSACVRLVPGTITGIQPAPIRTAKWESNPAPDLVLWTPFDGSEQTIPASVTLLLANELPDEIRALLWPSPEPMEVPCAPRLSSDAVTAEDAL